jgi:hypothetical protein
LEDYQVLIRTTFAAMLATASFTPHVHAAEADYYVHYTIAIAANQYASTTVNVDAADGPALVRPNGACGMRFEYPDDADWLIPIYDDEDTNTLGHINVWLPSSDCSAWNKIEIEPDNDGEDDVTFAPHSVPGTLRVADAKAYWIDGAGKKLVYKHCCGKDAVTVGDKVTAGIAQSSAELKAVKRSLGVGSSTAAIDEQLAASQQTLHAVSADLQQAMAQRQTIAPGRLDGAVRGLERDAQTLIGDALLSHTACRGYFGQGDLTRALIACDAAFSAVESAHAVLATMHNWLN